MSPTIFFCIDGTILHGALRGGQEGLERLAGVLYGNFAQDVGKPIAVALGAAASAATVLNDKVVEAKLLEGLDFNAVCKIVSFGIV